MAGRDSSKDQNQSPLQGAEDYKELLRSVYFLRNLQDSDLELVAERCSEQQFAPGETIFREGDRGERFYIILSGDVEIWKRDPQLGEQLLAIQGPGEMFGEIALVDDLSRSATVMARGPVRALYLTRERLDEVLDASSSVGRSLLRSLASMVRESNRHYLEDLRARNRKLEQAYRRLEATQNELLRAERLSTLGKFSGMLLHDLRNPLSVLRGFAELIYNHHADPERVRRYAARIVKEAERLDELTTELLDYSRGEIRLELQPVSIDALFATVRSWFESSERESEITLKVRNELSDTVLLDEKRMLRVLWNLVENAAKAMPKGGDLVLEAVTEEDERLCITVRDTGFGMTEEVRARVFEPFFSTAHGGGTGLGMVVVRTVVEAHGGSVSLSSEPNHGTTVRLRLPLNG